MDSKKLIAILAVVIIIVAGVAVWMTAEPKEEERLKDYGGTLLVYGNANEDSVIDEADIKALEQMIAGEIEKTKFADANHDGEVDEKDIEYVKKLIAREKGTVVHYVDGGEFDATVTWPVDKVNVLYRAQQTAVAVGLDDTKVQMISQMDNIFKNKFKNAVWDTTNAGLDDYDAMTAPGIPDAIITVTTPGTALDPAIKAIYSKAGIDIIRVANMEGYGTAATALTLGYLVGTVEQSQKYAAWNTDMLKEISSIVASIPADKIRTGQMWMGGYFATGVGHGYTEAMEFAGLKALADWEGLKPLNMDNRAWFYNYDPDVIIRTMGIGYSAPAEKGIGIYKTWAPVIEQMRAYVNDDFCVIDSSMPQSLRIAYTAEFAYPEFFKQGYGDEWHQKLIDLYGIDVKCDGQFMVTAEDVRNAS